MVIVLVFSRNIFSEDHDHMCRKAFLRELGHGHRPFLSLKLRGTIPRKMARFHWARKMQNRNTEIRNLAPPDSFWPVEALGFSELNQTPLVSSFSPLKTERHATPSRRQGGLINMEVGGVGATKGKGGGGENQAHFAPQHMAGSDWAMIWGGAKRMGEENAPENAPSRKILDPSKRSSGLLNRGFLYRKSRATTREEGGKRTVRGASKTPFWEGCHL